MQAVLFQRQREEVHRSRHRQPVLEADTAERRRRAELPTNRARGQQTGADLAQRQAEQSVPGVSRRSQGYLLSVPAQSAHSERRLERSLQVPLQGQDRTRRRRTSRKAQ